MASSYEVDPNIVDPELQARFEVIGLGQELIATAQLRGAFYCEGGWLIKPLSPGTDTVRHGAELIRGGFDWVTHVEIEPDGAGIKMSINDFHPQPDGSSIRTAYAATVHEHDEEYLPTTQRIVSKSEIVSGAWRAWPQYDPKRDFVFSESTREKWRNTLRELQNATQNPAKTSLLDRIKGRIAILG